MADQGGLRHRLFFDQTEAQRAGKIFLGDRAPFLSKGLDDRASPYLKVWIQHCYWLAKMQHDS